MVSLSEPGSMDFYRPARNCFGRLARQALPASRAEKALNYSGSPRVERKNFGE